MSRLVWGIPGARQYEMGVDRGVLYVTGLDGVPWNGLVSVSEQPTGGAERAFFMDGEKFLSIPAKEWFEATVTAFTYPDEFGLCDGTHTIRPGLRFAQQRRKPFGLSYRTKIGNDLTPNAGYKIHIVYNALAAPSPRENSTIGSETDLTDFTWLITTKPQRVAGHKSTAHVTIDSRETNPVKLAQLEDILYGNNEENPRLPTLDELIAIYDDVLEFSLVDNMDGTFTVQAPDSALDVFDNGQFVLNWPTAEPVDEETYTIASE